MLQWQLLALLASLPFGKSYGARPIEIGERQRALPKWRRVAAVAILTPTQPVGTVAPPRGAGTGGGA